MDSHPINYHCNRDALYRRVIELLVADDVFPNAPTEDINPYTHMKAWVTRFQFSKKTELFSMRVKIDGSAVVSVGLDGEIYKAERVYLSDALNILIIMIAQNHKPDHVIVNGVRYNRA